MKPKTRKTIHSKYDGRCAYCGCEITQSQMHIDHIQPKYNGGTDEMDNLNPACYPCNSYKNTYTVEAFRRELKRLFEKNKHYLFASKSKQNLAENYGAITYNIWDGKFYFERVQS